MMKKINESNFEKQCAACQDANKGWGREGCDQDNARDANSEVTSVNCQHRLIVTNEMPDTHLAIHAAGIR